MSEAINFPLFLSVLAFQESFSSIQHSTFITH
jgi:hypothetical protein